MQFWIPIPRKPPCYDTLLMINKYATENYFLGLESYSLVDSILGSIEDTNISLNVQDMEHNWTFNIEDETYEKKTPCTQDAKYAA